MRGCQVPRRGNPANRATPHRMSLISRIEHAFLFFIRNVFLFLHRKHGRVCAPGLPELRMVEGGVRLMRASFQSQFAALWGVVLNRLSSELLNAPLSTPHPRPRSCSAAWQRPKIVYHHPGKRGRGGFLGVWCNQIPRVAPYGGLGLNIFLSAFFCFPWDFPILCT